ncbi:MAG TPA: endonuclease/exonuclease/phosphatase family protein [Eudoraea sp.]|nr:endonuclease/exonuclease/phosphatase family protein [Eudoraea sp.]
MKGRTGFFVLLFVGMAFGVAAQTMDVLTYNIRYDNPRDSINNWDNRKGFLISQLIFHEPAIFGTQEGLLHQLQDIKGSLAGYTFFGKGRDDGREAGEFSAIFYDQNKLKLLRENTFWLSETPEVPSKGWDAAIKRVCTYGLFQTKEGRAVFWVFNTHLDHIGERARLESIRLIQTKIKEINTENFPVVLMGDLNLDPDHPAIKFLAENMDDTQILAGSKAFGPTGTFNGFMFNEAVKRRIDYIFTSQDDFEILKYGILSDSKDGRYPSDHLPVYVRLEFRK